jgi:hypothetical protein
MTLFEEIAKGIIESRMEILGTKREDEGNHGFGLNLIPCSFPGTWGFDIVNTFSTVLSGLISTREEESFVNVLRTDLHTGPKEAEHNFFLSSIPKVLWMSSIGIPVVNVFSFIGASTSGYHGSGPQVHQLINDIIKKYEDEVAFKILPISLTEHENIRESFRKNGPILQVNYPDL